MPVFDGRRGFDLNNLRHEPMIGRELSQGSAVMAIFCLHKFHPYGSMASKYNVEKNDIIVSFNLRAVVLLLNKDDAFSLDQNININKRALGVEIPELDQTKSLDVEEENIFGSNAGSETVRF